jgi:hypothetical protein
MIRNGLVKLVNAEVALQVNLIAQLCKVGGKTFRSLCSFIGMFCFLSRTGIALQPSTSCFRLPGRGFALRRHPWRLFLP